MKSISVVVAAAAALVLAACSHKAPAGVAAEVNGFAITFADLDKTYQSQYAQQAEGATEDQILTQKLDVLSNLITNEIMLQRAEKMGLAAVNRDGETKISKMARPQPNAEFEEHQ